MINRKRKRNRKRNRNRNRNWAKNLHPSSYRLRSYWLLRRAKPLSLPLSLSVPVPVPVSAVRVFA
ncbi:MAG TPA: hypothetical protein VK666_27690 [Chryseolinea sp.]|nr:hypothetical protein [Chryseolinea sp.]